MSQAPDQKWTEADLLDACKDGNVPIVYQCIWANVNINCKVEKTQVTPLSLAARNGHEKVVRILLENGAEDSMADKAGATAAHWAAHNGHTRVVEALVSHSEFNLTAKDKYGSTPLHFAAIQNKSDVVASLIMAGADATASNNAGLQPADITEDEHIKGRLNQSAEAKALALVESKRKSVSVDASLARKPGRRHSRVAGKQGGSTDLPSRSGNTSSTGVARSMGNVIAQRKAAPKTITSFGKSMVAQSKPKENFELASGAKGASSGTRPRSKTDPKPKEHAKATAATNATKSKVTFTAPSF